MLITILFIISIVLELAAKAGAENGIIKIAFTNSSADLHLSYAVIGTFLAIFGIIYLTLMPLLCYTVPTLYYPSLNS